MPDKDDVPDDDRLGLDADTMRRTGYAVVDALVEHLTDTDAPALRRADPDEMRRRLAGPPPEGPVDFDTLLGQLRDDVLSFMARSDHPGYFAFIPSNGTWPSALGDFVASATNIYAGSWMEAAGPSEVERTVLGWFADWLGLPATTAGVLVSGGSAANMTALACAREHEVGAMADDLVAYVSDQAHSSLARAGRVLGFRPDQLRVVPVDNEFRLRPDALVGAIEADRSHGRRPLFVCAAAGSTNTGAIDPLPEVADICAQHGVWMHVDAAYGGFAAITERGRRALAGIERADSVTLDPHKWLYQPFECGAVLVRDGDRLRRAFEITPDYLKDAERGDDEVNFADLGMQLSRMSRAIKVWLSIRYFGLAAYRATVDRCVDLALLAERHIDRSDELELLFGAHLGIVCFRRHPPGVDDEATLDRINAELVHSFAESGRGLVSSTRLDQRYAIRLCVLNHTSGERDVLDVLRWLDDAPVEGAGPSATPSAAVEPTGLDRLSFTGLGWGERSGVGVGVLDGVALFAGMTGEARAAVAQVCHEEVAAAGDHLVRRWDIHRDVYVVLDGSVDVLIDGRVVRSLGAGDFFGELAARDWGAGFGYSRLADVVATTPVRLLVLPHQLFADLVRRVPSVRAQIEAAAKERLSRR